MLVVLLLLLTRQGCFCIRSSCFRASCLRQVGSCAESGSNRWNGSGRSCSAQKPLWGTAAVLGRGGHFLVSFTKLGKGATPVRMPGTWA